MNISHLKKLILLFGLKKLITLQLYEHPKNIYYEWRTRMAWFDERLVGKIVFPNWMGIFDLFATIHKVKLTRKEKLLCYLSLMGPILFRNSRELLRDVKFMVVMTFHSDDWRENRYAETKGW